jgi:hypothetical protein
MKKFILTLLLMANTFAAPLSPEYEKKVRSIYEYMRKSTHTKLGSKKLTMDFYRIDNPDYFMESNFHVFPRLVLGKKKYRIGVNPLIFEQDIPRDALLGVMAHELVHTEDYENKKVLSVGLKLLRKKSKRRYERSTDLRVIFKGFGHHLIQYKLWQYSLLTPEALELKKKEYLSPEEVNFVRDTLEKLSAEDRVKIKKIWVKKTPLSLEEFERTYEKFLNSLN